MTTTHHILSRTIRRAAAQLPYLPRTLALVWAAAPRWTLAWAALLVVQGVLPVATVYLTRQIVDNLVAVSGAGGTWEVLRPVLIPAGLMAGVLLLSVLLGGLTRWVRTAQAELVKDYMAGLVQDQSASVDMSFYDSPDYYDRLHRARVDASSRPLSLLENAGSLLQNGVTLVAMAAVLIPYGPWLPAALLVSTLPAFYVVMQHRLRLHRWRMATTSDERRAWYHDWLLTDRDTAAELRLFDLAAHFKAAYQALRRRLRHERMRLARDQSAAELWAGLAALGVTGVAMVWMLRTAVLGLITLGDLALVYQAFNQGQRMMRSLLENLGEIYSNSLFLRDLFEFLSLQPHIVDPAQPTDAPAAITAGIRFEAVTFHYPDSARPALRDFDLTVPAGKIVALVGPNGAGKSTVIKLLCRLYDPQAGRIALDGTDLRQLRIQDLRRMITVLFQEPVHYNTSAAQNIGLGDLPAQPSRADIEAAAHASAADEPIGRLPHGYDTLLGRWFSGGVDLSTGEWQRVALARAFLRRAPIIILDEPTSAMDAWAEDDWLRRFRQLAAGRTAIVITHRFTTARCADIIHIVEEGQVVESGSHDELVAAGGRYARSWSSQVSGRREGGEPSPPDPLSRYAGEGENCGSRRPPDLRGGVSNSGAG